MGEGLSGDGVPGRRVHPSGAASGRWDVRADGALETVLTGVLREGALDPEAEHHAVAAFRTARDTGAHRARTRRRDNWRPPAERRAGRPVKATLGVVFASHALGSVAVAAIGSARSSSDGADEVHCRAYEQIKDRGKALEATAWQRLIAAAGGKDKVAAYCTDQLARAAAASSKPGNTGKPSAGAANPGKGAAGNTGASGNGHSGADNAAGQNGAANGGKGSGKNK